MKKWILLVAAIVMFSSMKSFAGDLKLKSKGVYQIKDANMNVNDFMRIASSKLQEEFQNDENDITFSIYETFFRNFVDAYQNCTRQTRGPEYNLIRDVLYSSKKEQIYLNLEYPFQNEDGCEYKDVDLYYQIKKEVDKGHINFSFQNDYGHGRFAIRQWAWITGFKSVLPFYTDINIKSNGGRTVNLYVETTALDIVPRLEVDEDQDTRGESLEVHNKKLIHTLKRLIDRKILESKRQN
jgi:hypothetical protein